LSYALERRVAGDDYYKSTYSSWLFSNSSGVTLLINNTGVHASGVYVQEYFNAIMASAYRNRHSNRGKLVLDDGNLTDDRDTVPQLTAHAHPFPVNQHQRDMLLQLQTAAIAFNIMIAFGFVSAFGMVFVVMEKELEIKIQQFINGVSVVTYWTSNFVFDVMMYFIPVMTLWAILSYYNVDNLVTGRSLLPFLTIMLMFALAMPPFTYLLGHAFKNSGSALTITLTVNIIFGSILFVIIAIFGLLPNITGKKVSRWLEFFALFWPLYNVGNGLETIAVLRAYWSNMGTYPEDLPDSYFEECDEGFDNYERLRIMCARSMWDTKYAIGRNLIYLAVEVVVYFIIVVLIDFMQQDIRTRQFLQRYVYREPIIDNSDETRKFNAIMMRSKRDGDVLDEEERVREQSMTAGGTKHTSVFVKGVSKLFYVPQTAA
jgi:hypothetical protein